MGKREIGIGIGGAAVVAVMFGNWLVDTIGMVAIAGLFYVTYRYLSSRRTDDRAAALEAKQKLDIEMAAHEATKQILAKHGIDRNYELQYNAGEESGSAGRASSFMNRIVNR